MLLRHPEHTVGIYGFFASLSQAASQERLLERHHRLLWWETGLSCERRYPDHERWHNLRPDAMGEYQTGEQRAFLVGMGSGNHGDARSGRQVHDVHTVCDLTRVVQRAACHADLLVIVPGKEQEMRIASIAAAVLVDAPGLVIRTTTATRLADHGPLAAVWYQVPTNKKRTELVPRSRFYLTSDET